MFKSNFPFFFFPLLLCDSVSLVNLNALFLVTGSAALSPGALPSFLFVCVIGNSRNSHLGLVAANKRGEGGGRGNGT